MMRYSAALPHPTYLAFVIHRVSGLLLALFLPLHFWALGSAIRGEASLDGFLRWTDSPLVKAAEFGLVLPACRASRRRVARCWRWSSSAGAAGRGSRGSLGWALARGRAAVLLAVLNAHSHDVL